MIVKSLKAHFCIRPISLCKTSFNGFSFKGLGGPLTLTGFPAFVFFGFGSTALKNGPGLDVELGLGLGHEGDTREPWRSLRDGRVILSLRPLKLTVLDGVDIFGGEQDFSVSNLTLSSFNLVSIRNYDGLKLVGRTQ